jgi:hypothetical protein
MRQGPASITVTGMDLPSSSKNWDIPNFFPRMPMDMGGNERQLDRRVLMPQSKSIVNALRH